MLSGKSRGDVNQEYPSIWDEKEYYLFLYAINQTSSEYSNNGCLNKNK